MVISRGRIRDSEAEMFEKLSEAQPIGRMAVPDEVAALALYLCSDEASFVTGSSYPIDGGAVHHPGRWYSWHSAGRS
jgi:NAD(P)-dependent dehydrogenase (short-subunit alcohol dehydrogenase family)